MKLNWGNSENSKRKDIEQDHLMKELGVSYSSIEELLKELIVKPLER